MTATTIGDTGARYELRAFAQGFGLVEETLRRDAGAIRYRESLEVYILSAGNDGNNTKVRDGRMDIKDLVNRDRGLERWSPRMKGEFPLARGVILEQVLPALAVDAPQLRRDAYPFEDYLRDIIIPHPDLAAVSVFKQRLGFDIEGGVAELAKVYINGAFLRTVCLESTDPDRVLATAARIHLDNYENVSYPLAIKRVVGMAPLPAGAFYRAW
jgi:hypothetical protein